MRKIVEEVEDKGEQWHLMSPEEVLQRLRTTEAGLSSEEVEKRQQRYGKNEITTADDRISILKILIAQFNALIVILLVATAISAAFGNMIDAAVIFGAVILCVALGFLFEFRSEKALRAL